MDMRLTHVVPLHWPGTGIGDYIVLGVVLILATYVIALNFREHRRPSP